VVLIRALEARGMLSSINGRIAVGWLIVEDLAMIVVLVLLPPLAGVQGTETWTSLAVTLGKVGLFIALMLVLGRRLFPKLLLMVARTGSRELFTLAVLVIALGIAVGASKLFGVSMELGAFLAGMVVARSDFSTRAATDALPMKDAFGVLFFVSVGMLFDFRTLVESPWLAVATIGIVLIGKPAAAIAICVMMRCPLKTTLAVGAVLSQIGEFSFIVGTIAKKYGIIDDKAFNVLVATAIVTITLAPMIYKGVTPLERWLSKLPAIRRLSEIKAGEEKAHIGSYLELEQRAVIVGHGPVGSTVGHLLRDNGIEPVFIEMNVATVQKLRSGNRPAVHGDASHPETLVAAGIETAGILVLSASGVESGTEIIRQAKHLNPKIQVLARTTYLREAKELRQAGASGVFTGEGEVAMAMTAAILRNFSATPEQVERERERVRRDLFEIV
jgi:CPA2 family monovalent cation:H+ antiporter-2